ncbi:MAG TPA: hypothetical protein VMX55_01815 [candidate division Zixibacteria bacterium]|nr:hypothetical protein [candidate division Zixibacteria bacterium]
MKIKPKQILLIFSLIFIFSSSSFTHGMTINNLDYRSNGYDEENEDFVINNPIEFKCSYRQIVAYDNYLFIVPDYSPYRVHFLVLNISNPKKPIEITINSEHSFSIQKIELFENYLIILNCGLIEIYNAADPKILPYIGEFNCSKFGYITDFFVNKNILTILTNNITNDDKFIHTILTYDLSIIESPSLLFNYTFIDRNLYTRGQLHGNNVFLLSIPTDYHQSVCNLTIINFENKTHPTIINDLILTKNINSMQFYNNILYFTTTSDGLQILDLNDLNTTQNLRRIFSYNSLKEITIKENIGYLLSYDSVFILNLTNLNNIKLLGVYETRSQGIGFFDDFCVNENFIYAVRTAEYSDRGIFIIDIDDLENPKKIFPSGFVLSSETKLYLGAVFSGIGFFGIPLIIIISVIIIFIRKKKKKKLQTQEA